VDLTEWRAAAMRLLLCCEEPRAPAAMRLLLRGEALAAGLGAAGGGGLGAGGWRARRRLGGWTTHRLGATEVERGE